MNVALLVLRLVVGGLFVGHGAQKLFGWFGGQGLKGTASAFESIGLKPGVPLALVAGLAELGGGALLASGLFLPAAAALLVAVMAAATVSVHWPHGLWSTNGGYELPLVMATAAFALAAIGPGSVSLQDAFGWEWAGLWWAVAAALAGVLAGLTAVGLGRVWQRTHDRRPLAQAA
ncbi:MAG TPA: DoxX family protein [Gaiellaceae bacterium]|nr:DoxX family protein [Gaiellaceae bacterium]